MSTAWGDAVLYVQGDAIVRIDPPHKRERTAGQLGLSVPSVVRNLAAALAAYFDGEPVELADRTDVAHWLEVAGVDGFRRDVSLTLLDVPRSVTISYGELAVLAGRPGAARAAGSTCARNPLPIVIPCHRVVHAGARRGDVGSYGAASGPAYKRRLLELENAPLVRTD